MLGRKGRRVFDGTPEGFGRSGSPAPSSLLATCPGCGDVVVDVVGTRVRRAPDAGTCWYGFVCPSCARPVEIAAPGHLAAVLLCLGATEESPLAELLEPHDGPPLTVDDVLDLALALGTVDDVAGLAGDGVPDRTR
jgi:hypothetical protein